MMEKLAGRHITAGNVEKSWGGVSSKIKKDDFAAAFWQWLDRFKKCVAIGGSYVEKS